MIFLPLQMPAKRKRASQAARPKSQAGTVSQSSAIRNASGGAKRSRRTLLSGSRQPVGQSTSHIQPVEVNQMPNPQPTTQSRQVATEDIVTAVIDSLEQRGVIPKIAPPPPSETTTQPNMQAPPQPEVQPTALQRVSAALHVDEDQPPPVAGVVPMTNIVSYNLSLGALVSDKVKQAIWNNEFVEMSLLLPKHSIPEDDTLVLHEDGKLAIKTKQPNKLLTIGQWLTAFHVFIDIYVQKLPAEISGLLAYINLVRDLERAYGTAAFNTYDRNFRAHRQTQALPWGVMHAELWIRSTMPSVAQQGRPRSSPVRTKVCQGYNKPSGCSYVPCKFAHTCSHCGKKHPMFSCFALGNKREGNNAAARSVVLGPSADRSFRTNNSSTNAGKK